MDDEEGEYENHDGTAATASTATGFGDNAPSIGAYLYILFAASCNNNNNNNNIPWETDNDDESSSIPISEPAVRDSTSTEPSPRQPPGQ